MLSVTVSPKFQVVIPKKIREGMAIKPGDKVQVIQYRDRLELVPIKKPSEMRGFLPGLDTSLEREEDRV